MLSHHEAKYKQIQKTTHLAIINNVELELTYTEQKMWKSTVRSNDKESSFGITLASIAMVKGDSIRFNDY